jgi:predicted regulator of Ras-like GTPase activity (Roadblock/LC7/MglB family)
VTSAIAQALEAVTHVRGVRGAVLADRVEGLVVAESAMLGVKPEALAALGGGVLRRCGDLLASADLGAAGYLHLQGQQGTLVAVPVDDELLLLAVGDASVNVGLVRAALQRAVGAVQ